MDFYNINSINSFQAFIFWFFGVIGILIIKLLSWAMPKTANIIFDAVRDWLTRDLKSQLSDVNKKLENYKQEKHNIANELNILRSAVIFEDKDFLEIYKKKYGPENKQSD